MGTVRFGKYSDLSMSKAALYVYISPLICVALVTASISELLYYFREQAFYAARP